MNTIAYLSLSLLLYGSTLSCGTGWGWSSFVTTKRCLYCFMYYGFHHDNNRVSGDKPSSSLEPVWQAIHPWHTNTLDMWYSTLLLWKDKISIAVITALQFHVYQYHSTSWNLASTCISIICTFHPHQHALLYNKDLLKSYPLLKSVTTTLIPYLTVSSPKIRQQWPIVWHECFQTTFSWVLIPCLNVSLYLHPLLILWSYRISTPAYTIAMTPHTIIQPSIEYRRYEHMSAFVRWWEPLIDNNTWWMWSFCVEEQLHCVG